jgi:hypothetical protein
VRLSPFPFDPELPALPRVVDRRELGPAVAAALSEAGRPRLRRPDRLAVTVLRYRPGKRLTVLLTHPLLRVPLVAKAYHDQAKASAVAGEAPTSRPGPGPLEFAPAVGAVAPLGVVVQEMVDGVALDALTRSRHPTGAARDGVRSAAIALAQLHDLPATTARRRPVEHELVRFGARAERVTTVRPDLGVAAAALADRLVRVQRVLPAPRTGPVHGDCKPSQFLLRGTKVVLLDLDHVGIADQAVDVGTFLASLRQQALRHRRTPGRPDDGALDVLAADFLDTYVRARGADDQLARIQWHVAVALERKALRAFARAPGSWLPGLLVDEANVCLDRLEEVA